jgi:hypothetical protein
MFKRKKRAAEIRPDKKRDDEALAERRRIARENAAKETRGGDQ